MRCRLGRQASISRNLYFLPASLPTVAEDCDARVQLKADEQNHAIQLNPNHQHNECPDGSVEFVVTAKIIHIKGKSPGSDDGEDRCKHGPRIEERDRPPGRGPETVNGGKRGVEQQQNHHPTERKKGELRQLTEMHVGKNKLKEGVSQNDQEHGGHQHKCNKEGQLYGNQSFAKFAALFERGGVVFFKATHHRHHTVGRKPNGKHKTKGQKAFSRNGGDVFDGFKNHIARTARDDLFDGFLKRAEKIHTDREIRQQRNQHDQTGKNGQKKTKGHAVGAGHNRIFLKFIVDEHHQVINRNSFQTRERMGFGPFQRLEPKRVLCEITDDSGDEV